MSQKPYRVLRNLEYVGPKQFNTIQITFHFVMIKIVRYEANSVDKSQVGIKLISKRYPYLDPEPVL